MGVPIRIYSSMTALGKRVTCLKRHKIFASYDDPDNSSYPSCQTHKQTHSAESLEADPFLLPSWHLCLLDVHFNGKKDGQWPESQRTNQGDHVDKERKQHGNHCSAIIACSVY